jgi:hypothetical protein
MGLDEMSDGARVKRIFYGGIIISLDEKNSSFEAIAIDRKHRVFALGSDEEILPLKGTDTEVIYLNGIPSCLSYRSRGHALARSRVHRVNHQV